MFCTHTDIPAGPGGPGRPCSPVNPRPPGGPDWPGCPGRPIWPSWPLCPGSPVDPFWRKHHLSVSKARQVRVELQWLIHWAEHTSPLSPIRPAEPCQSKSGEHFIEAADSGKRHWTKKKKTVKCFNALRIMPQRRDIWLKFYSSTLSIETFHELSKW